jgi:hypothetical protein
MTRLAAASTPSMRAGLAQWAALGAKLMVTGASFWYVARQVDPAAVLAAVPQLDRALAAGAVAAIMLQIPLVGLRWRSVLEALAALPSRVGRLAIIAVTAIGLFFAQVLPSVAGDGIRAWYLVRLGGDWRHALTSVVIDRAVGVGLLVLLAFAMLLADADLAALGGWRDEALLVDGGLIVAGVLGLLLLPPLAPLLSRWRGSRWVGALALDARRVLLGPRSAVILALGVAVHALTITAVWSLACSLGLDIGLADAAVLFTVMVGVTIVPVSISGWGLRELAVVTLLARHGVPAESALLLSVSFGLTVVAAALPGALAWLLFSAPRPGTQGEAPAPIAGTGRADVSRGAQQGNPGR